MSTLRLRHITLGYPGRPLFEDAEIDLIGGRCVLLCGANGTGKSSLLRVISGLHRPQCIRLLGLEGAGIRTVCADLRRRVTYLHQHPYAFRGTVSANVAYGLPSGLDAVARRMRLAEALHWAGLAHLAHADATRLSCGERQRMALARAWARPSPFLLLDEPTANLDRESRERTLALLEALLAGGRGLLIATHDAHHFPGLDSTCLEIERRRLCLALPGTDRRVTDGTPRASGGGT